MMHRLLHHPGYTVYAFASATLFLLMVAAEYRQPFVVASLFIATVGLVGTFCMASAVHLDHHRAESVTGEATEMSDDRGLDPSVTGSAVRMDSPADAPLSIEQARRDVLDRMWQHCEFPASGDDPADEDALERLEQAIAAAAVTPYLTVIGEALAAPAPPVGTSEGETP